MVDYLTNYFIKYRQPEACTFFGVGVSKMKRSVVVKVGDVRPFYCRRAGRPTALNHGRGHRRRGAEGRATAGGARGRDEGPSRPPRRRDRVNVGWLGTGPRRQRTAELRRHGRRIQPRLGGVVVFLVYVACAFLPAPTSSISSASPISPFHIRVWVAPPH